MTDENKKWHDVPDELMEEWYRIFDAGIPTGICLPNPCPVCDKSKLRRYYMKGKPMDSILNGIRFVAHGALWEWCASCYSFVHGSTAVPEWWNHELELNNKKLTVFPDALEEALSELIEQREL